MKPLTLFCKSYRTDLKRVARLAASVRQFNTEGIELHLSVPARDAVLFREHLIDFDLVIHSDEEILRASPDIDLVALDQLPGNLTQQIVKSEFWRLNVSSAYLCLDSDALFIRPFTQSDFIAPDGTPYTTIDEGHEILEESLRQGKPRVADAFCSDAQVLQTLFGRQGRQYNFGPLPVVWHRAVWESLHKNYLRPAQLTLADAIVKAPSEARWYGEALLAYQAIPLRPCQALFKVYHYAWEFDRDRRHGLDVQQLSRLYCGVIYQSAWERELDWPTEGGNFFSRLGRRTRRRMGRI